MKKKKYSYATHAHDVIEPNEQHPPMIAWVRADPDAWAALGWTLRNNQVVRILK